MDEDDSIMHGYINSFDPFKGYGFIRREKGKDVFFHYSSLCSKEHSISAGDNVVFSIKKTPRGIQAFNIARNS